MTSIKQLTALPGETNATQQEPSKLRYERGQLAPGYCLVGKIPHPSGGGWAGGYRDGWVGWPQISAFWATRHPPPPPGGVRVRFLGVLGLCRALRSA